MFLFQKEYPWLSGLDFGIKTWKENGTRPITMNASDIVMIRGSWHIYDINLFIKNCNFTSFKIMSQNNNLTSYNTLHKDSDIPAMGSSVRISGGNIYFINATLTNMFSNEMDGVMHASSKTNVYFMGSKIVTITGKHSV